MAGSEIESASVKDVPAMICMKVQAPIIDKPEVTFEMRVHEASILHEKHHKSATVSNACAVELNAKLRD